MGEESGNFKLTPTKFCNVDYCELIDEEPQTTNGNAFPSIQFNVKQANMGLLLSPDNENIYLSSNDGKQDKWFAIKNHQISFLSKAFLLVTPNNSDNTSICLKFHSSKEARDFEKALKLCKLLKPSAKKAKLDEKPAGIFDSRTETNSADLYFQFYGYLNQQQNMLQDFVRTSTYQHAILSNTNDFNGKVVMDVGAGTGVLSFFAVQSGAKHVYAIEASSMALFCQELVRTNNLSDKILVLPGKVEDIDCPEKVDVLISEPMGYSLVNERMLESFVCARDRFLKPGGRMFPTTSTMYFSLFSDELVYQENVQKTAFWYNESFHGINLSALRSQAFHEVFKQPVIDTFSSAILCSEICTWTFDFEKDPVEKLHLIQIPFELKITRPCIMHGIATWFDVSFNGSQVTVNLSTGPDFPLTHWYQVRYFFTEPFLVHAGTIVKGRITFTANEKLSYDVDIYANVNGIEKTNRLDLKNPNFRYMSSGSSVVQQMPATSYYDGTLTAQPAHLSADNSTNQHEENNMLNMSYENIAHEEDGNEVVTTTEH